MISKNAFERLLGQKLDRELGCEVIQLILALIMLYILLDGLF